MKALEREVMRYLKERGWHNLHPGNVAKSISIEAAELLELFQWTHPTIAETKKDKAQLEKIRHELADVMIYSLELAALLGLDSEKIVREKLALARKKYPAALFRNAKQKGKDYGNDLYLKIRDAHRQNRK